MADRYRPLFKLDAGGMAEVYVAEAESVAGFKKKVAIKRVLPSLLKEERFVRMFLDEARLSLRLNHANIVTVFDIGKSSSTYFIVMEYVEGTNLKFVLQHLGRRTQPMPVHLAVWLLNEVLKGLEYAHNLRDSDTGRELGIVHRDISPPNVLVSWNGEVKLTDFGLAKASTQFETTDPGVVKGKFAYLSPEAARGDVVDRRADIFAAGILGFEMLTGRRLFLGENDYDTVERVRAAQIPNLREINPEIPLELEEILRKSLARDLHARYGRASDFADDLLGFLFSYGRKVSARDLSTFLADMRRVEPGIAAAAKADRAAGALAQSTNLILKLIADEFDDIRSLDEDSYDDPNSQSLDDLIGEGAHYDPSAPLHLDDFAPGSSEPSPAPIGVDVEPTPADRNSAPMNLGRGSTPMPQDGPYAPSGLSGADEPPKPPSAMPWVLMSAVVLLGVGALYVFVLS